MPGEAKKYESPCKSDYLLFKIDKVYDFNGLCWSTDSHFIFRTTINAYEYIIRAIGFLAIIKFDKIKINKRLL